MIRSRIIFLATLLGTFSPCSAKQALSNKPTQAPKQKEFPQVKISHTRTNNNATSNITSNQTISENLSIGNNLSTNTLTVLETMQVGNANCQSAHLNINGSANITDVFQVGNCINAGKINTKNIQSNTQISNSLTSNDIKTSSLSVSNNTTLNGILYVDEIDPMNGITTSFSGNVAIADAKKLLVNDINPVNNNGSENDNGIICFSGNVGINPDKLLLVNEINPVILNNAGVCTIDDTGTTTFSGNVIASQNLTIENTLLVNQINPATEGGYTCFSGDVAIPILHAPSIDTKGCANKSRSDPLTAIFLDNVFMDVTLGLPFTDGNVGIINLRDGEDQFHRFIHNYGPTGAMNGNTFVGTNAGNFFMGIDNEGGNNNSGFGSYTLSSNTSGTDNIAFGTFALQDNTSGSNNTALGSQALDYLITGTNNIAIGYEAGNFYGSWESNNITIGNAGIEHEQGVIRIGTSQAHCFIAGIDNAQVSGNPVYVSSSGQLGLSSSSKRYKKDINNMNKASAQLMQLRPVTFRYNEQSADAPLEYGLIAEEVAAVFPELAIYNKNGEPESVRYHVLPSLLLNEYQHQEKKLINVDKKIKILTQQVDEINVSDTQVLNILQRLETLEEELKNSPYTVAGYEFPVCK